MNLAQIQTAKDDAERKKPAGIERFADCGKVSAGFSTQDGRATAWGFAQSVHASSAISAIYVRKIVLTFHQRFNASGKS